MKKGHGLSHLGQSDPIWMLNLTTLRDLQVRAVGGDRKVSACLTKDFTSFSCLPTQRSKLTFKQDVTQTRD